AAGQLAKSLVDRARKGEDFGQLAKDYSEGPGRQQGGIVNRWVQPSELGAFAGYLDTLAVNGISDPIPGSGRFMIFKVQQRVPDPTAKSARLRVAQIVVKVHGNDNVLRDQEDQLMKLRGRAARIGLGRAAAEKGMATLRTRPYDMSSTPEELY